LAAAFAAATGLHLLIFQLWANSGSLFIHTERDLTLQIDLVKVAKQPKQSAAAPEKEKLINTQRKVEQIKTSPSHIVRHERKQLNSSKKPSPIRSQEAVKQVSTTISESIKAAVTVEPETVIAANMPAEVQQMILSHIHYPRQARRKGWQGNAT